MKIKILLFSLLAAGSAAAGTYSYASKQAVVQEDPFEEMFRVSMFGSYQHQLSGGVNNADDWGAGLSLYVPLGDSPLGIEAGYMWQEGNITDVHSANAALRLYLFDLGPVAVYTLAGAGYQFTGSENAWAYRAGVGVDVPLTERITAFADWSYQWPDRPSIGETGLARLGLAYSF